MEVELIQNYITLQSYRVGKNAKIVFNTSIEKKGLKIAPMLFLPLVENAYKHGIKGDIENTFLKIDLKGSSKKIHFLIKNNKGSTIENGKTGVGISNIKSRLELIYPNKYEFSIDENDSTFIVELTINL